MDQGAAPGWTVPGQERASRSAGSLITLLEAPVTRSLSFPDRDWSAFDLLADPVTVWDRELRCRYANEAAVRRFGGGDPRPVVGRLWQELLPAGLGRAFVPPARTALTGRSQTFRHSDTGDAGRTRHIHATCAPWQTAGRVAGLVLTLTDVTTTVDADSQPITAR